LSFIGYFHLRNKKKTQGGKEGYKKRRRRREKGKNKEKKRDVFFTFGGQISKPVRNSDGSEGIIKDNLDKRPLIKGEKKKDKPNADETDDC